MGGSVLCEENCVCTNRSIDRELPLRSERTARIGPVNEQLANGTIFRTKKKEHQRAISTIINSPAYVQSSLHSIPFHALIVTNMNSSVDSCSAPPVKSRRGRKRVTDPVLVTELKRHRRSRANDRERTRMRLLNEALEHLRTMLPLDSNTCYSSADSSSHGTIMEDKLTKIETLRTASAYIRLLTDLLDDNQPPSASSCYPYHMPDSHPQQQASQVYSHPSYVAYPPAYPFYPSYC